MHRCRFVSLGLIMLVVVSTAAWPAVREVTVQERAAIRAIIQELYGAYSRKDLDRVMAIEKEAIEDSALDYQKRGRGKPDDVRKAFREGTSDIFNHPKFSMRPMQLDDLEYRRVDDTIVVSSAVPIIATERVQVEGPSGSAMVRLRIGQFVFKKKNDAYQIVKMYFY